MSITLLPAAPSLTLEGCPQHVLEDAIATSRSVARIVWDDPGTPEHCLGYVQWSTRPYRVTDRCDGTRDSNAILVCRVFCRRTGVDLPELYAKAYPDDENIFLEEAYIAHLDEQQSTTEIPEFSTESALALLSSLYDMNWRSLVEKLSQSWCAKGYPVDIYADQ